MPALVWWCLIGCPSERPRPDPVGPVDTDALPTDTDTDGAGPDTDGADTDTDGADTDAAPPRRVEAEIVFPSHGETVTVGETVYLEGEARVDGQEVDGAELRWTSSRDGFLGEDADLPWRPDAPGRHVIELEVELGAASDRDWIDVDVRP